MHDDQLQTFTEEAPAAGCSGSSSCNGKIYKMQHNSCGRKAEEGEAQRKREGVPPQDFL